MAEKRRPSVHSFFPFFSHRAALVLSLLAFTAGMNPVAGDTCDGVAAVLRKGEVAIICPLTADINRTKHSIEIKHFNRANEAEYVLECDWMSSLNKFDCPRSHVGAELIRIQPDRVLALLPKDRLGNGTYRCQLVPPDRDDPFTDCTICDPEIPPTLGAKTATTPIPATTTTTSSIPATHANDECLSTVKAIMALTIVAIVLLVVIVLGWIVRSGNLYIKPYRLRDWCTGVHGHRNLGCVEGTDEVEEISERTALDKCQIPAHHQGGFAAEHDYRLDPLGLRPQDSGQISY